jgi:DNA polymerase IV
VKLRYDDFRIVTRETTLPAHIREPQAIRQAAARCLKKELLGRRLRLLGVRAGGLCNVNAIPSPTGAMDSGEGRDQLLLPLF